MLPRCVWLTTVCWPSDQSVCVFSAAVGEEQISSIGRGLCVLLGISAEDTQRDADYLWVDTTNSSFGGFQFKCSCAVCKTALTNLELLKNVFLHKIETRRQYKKVNLVNLLCLLCSFTVCPPEGTQIRFEFTDWNMNMTSEICISWRYSFYL